MMFPWNLAKSAEAILSRFALRRVCKFLLKKKLGQFIHGDIDLDQLDVQLAAGIIELTNLALNVDYLNQQLDASVFRVREGSVRSLLVKMPWNGKGCEVEVDELEIVLSPYCNDGLDKVAGPHDSNQDSFIAHDLVKDEHGVLYKSTTASVSVHEGVKTVAKMVKWLLTSFHIRIKNVIVAFDACVEKHEQNLESHGTLVLRVAEIECGTLISEDSNSTNGGKPEDFLGISHLTNFLKFQGAILELLQMNGVNNQAVYSSDQVTASDSCPPNTSKPLLTGEKGGFCGSLKLSIPWKNGSLDIRKVNAEVNLDPLTAKLHPSTLKWILVTWEMLEKCTNERANNEHLMSTSHYSSPLPSALLGEEKPIPESEGSIDFCFPLREEKNTDVLLEDPRLISDWMPFSVGNRPNEEIEEANLGASVDQFFECFDGMRSSQLELGGSGMWSWTCSVFSAITAASNLASGSVNISAEQQHVQTNLKINLVGVSTIFSFLDEDQPTQHGPSDEQIDADSTIHHLGSRCQDIRIVVQVYPQEWKLEATINHIDLDHYYSRKEDSINLSLHDHGNGVSGQTRMIRGLQDKVQSVLPSTFLFPEGSSVKLSDVSNTVENFRSNMVKATLFETSGPSHCVFAVSSRSFDGDSTQRASFSLKLPPLIFWLDFNLVNMVFDFTRKLGNFSSEPFGEKHASSGCCGVSKSSDHLVTSTPRKGSLQGDIFLPHARIILCFPFKNGGGGFRSYTSWDQFIALEFSSPPNFKNLKAEGFALDGKDTSWKKDSPSTSRVVRLNIANLDVYHVTRSVGDNCGSPTELESQRFYAHKVLSLGNGTNWVRLLSMVWHENAVTGAWIMKNAKLLATSDDRATKMSSGTSGYEFASVSTRKDIEDLSSQKQKEMLLSSKFVLHLCLSSMVVTLCRSRYLGFFHLLDQVMVALSGVSNNATCDSRGKTVNQTSILLECGPMEIELELDHGDCPKSSFQRELPGSWNKLRLEIEKFQLLSVSDIGAVSGANFLWISHGEGKLWGSITTVADQELLLISCSHSSNRRGDGEGSNVLSSSPAGSDIVHLWDPESFHIFMSITVKCVTIVAPGGRLDWLEKIFSFFSLPSPETNQAAECKSHEGSRRASFVLKLIDGALSYEPYFRNSEVNRDCLDENPCDSYVACLLAASSLTLSNTKIEATFDNDYNIRFQDVGLLLHQVSNHENLLGEYGVDRLRGLGYVKVAGEALLDATLRINCENDISWELNCSESHIVLSTCYDTTSGLIRLASQIQQLFAPDMEESIVHLQNRWNSLQKMQGRDDSKERTKTSINSSLETSPAKNLGPDSKDKSGLVGLMDEICEDTFVFCGKGLSSFDGSVHLKNRYNSLQHVQGRDDSREIMKTSGNYSPGKSKVQQLDPDSKGISGLVGLVDGICEDALVFCGKGVSTFGGSEFNISVGGNLHDPCSENLSDEGHTSIKQKAELIEGYCLSGLRSLSELTINSHFPEDISKTKSVSSGNADLQRRNSGWYGKTSSLSIVENYVSDRSDQTSSNKLVDGQKNSRECDGSKRYKGRIILKNIEVKWRMCGGSDWQELGDTVRYSGDISGRNGSVCLELVLYNMNIQYDIFPEGGICVSKLGLSIQDFHLYDKSRHAPWRLMLGYYHSKERPRESSSKALKFDLEVVRPDPMTPLEEYRLRIAFLPILLHLHQSQLDFLIAFFGGKSSPVDQSQGSPQSSGSSDVISVNDNNLDGVGIADEALLPFFQKFDIWPIVIRVDYRPSRVDLAALSGGKYVELVNLVPWKGVELQLKHVQAAGVYGWNNVCEITIGEWLEDISQNQIQKLLQGLPPIRSLVAVGSGAAKLVSLPVKNYRKDHRLVKGLQRGTVAFLRSISVEAIGLGVNLAAGAHEILLHAECILTRIQPSIPRPTKSKLKTNPGSDQPEDAQHGLQQAYESLSDGLGKSASALIRTPMKTYQRGGGTGSALLTAVRGAPAAAIAPASAAAQALHCALLGVRNSLDPEHKKESMNKYLGPSPSWKQS